MSCVTISNRILKSFVILMFTKSVHLRPHDICFDKFDERDCKLPPKQVFYYYKEGSRCEIKTWRGCPTLNKFDNEFNCSHHCVGKLWARASGEGFGKLEKLENLLEEIDTCAAILNTKDCNQPPKEVYTYKNGVCSSEKWYGCDSQNKFNDQASCIKACVTTVEEWVEEITALDIPEVEDIKTILDDVIEDSNRVPLNHNPRSEHEYEPMVESENENKNESESEKEAESEHENKAMSEHEDEPKSDHENEAEIEKEKEAESEHDNEPESEKEKEVASEHENDPENEHEKEPASEHEDKSDDDHENNENKDEPENETESPPESEHENEPKNVNKIEHENEPTNEPDNETEPTAEPSDDEVEFKKRRPSEAGSIEDILVSKKL